MQAIFNSVQSDPVLVDQESEFLVCLWRCLGLVRLLGHQAEWESLSETLKPLIGE